MDLSYIADEILKKLQEQNAILPITLVSEQKYSDLVRVLENRGVCNSLAPGLIDNEADFPPRFYENTSVYVTEVCNKELLSRLLNRYNFVCLLSRTDKVEILKGEDTFHYLPIPAHNVRYKFQYLPEQNVVYGVNNKVASTYVCRCLLGTDREGDFERRGEASLKMKDILSRSNDMYKFTVVRNPYSRLVSCYMHIIGGRANIPTEKNVFFRRSLGLPVTGEISFDSFISKLEEVGFAWTVGAEHWVPQSIVTCFGTVKYSSIGLHENMGQYLKSTVEPVLRERGWRGSFSTTDKYRVSGASLVWKTFVENTSIRDRIYSLYEIDFDLFNYTKSISKWT